MPFEAPTSTRVATPSARDAAPDAASDAAPDARPDVGITSFVMWMVRGHLERGELLRLLPEHAGGRTPISFVYPSPHLITVRLRAFIDVLVAQFPERELRS